MNTITMSEETWNELKARVEVAIEWVEALADCTALYERRVLIGMSTDLRALMAEVDDANTRQRYMALAADDQMSLFDVEGAAI